MTADPRERLNLRTIEVSFQAAMQRATSEERARLVDTARLLYARARTTTRDRHVVAEIDARLDGLTDGADRSGEEA